MYSKFEVKVRYNAVQQDGKEKSVTETYLFDALRFTEAEAKATKEFGEFITGEFTITNINRANYTEMILDDSGDYFFACKVAFLSLDEKTAKERRSVTNWLIQAQTLQEAKDKVTTTMGDTIADYKIEMVKETAIVEVYTYEKKDNK